MRYTKPLDEVSARTPVKEKTGSLEEYLLTCPNHCEMYEFATSQEAYEFGKKLRENAIKEEGVNHADQMKKFDVDISYTNVRIKLVITPELARR